MTRPIVTDPSVFDGAPYISGTSVTVAEVQAYWRKSGVDATQIRMRFPELSEAELGNAVTYVVGGIPKYSFYAESTEPPLRRFFIYGETGDWMFVCNELDDSGNEVPGWDFWEVSFEAIRRYPESYSSGEITWKDMRSGEPIDIYALDCDEGENP